MTGSPEYKAWSHIRDRCHNPRSAGYYKYGARGITVCDRWRESFPAFLEDMGRRPSSDYSIDRINNDGNYEPGNCRWATMKEQQNNRRSNHLISYKGQTKTLTQWSEEKNLSPKMVLKRLQRGWAFQKAIGEA